ncbi:Metaxin-2 [Dactylella cylindrospora]|nr:Metaxin-2 [Dactylella cylindrospora]
MASASTSPSAPPSASRPTTSSTAKSPSSKNDTTADSIFRAPKIIRVLFDTFPLYTHPIDPLPLTSREMRMTAAELEREKSSNTPTLYIFSLPEDAEDCVPSFNPACLKWQTYLRIRGVDFRTVSSNNHASPSGSLPFLVIEKQRAKSSGRPSPKTIPASKLAKWIEDNADGSVSNVDLDSPDCRAFTSLIETNIRDAWLYALYIEPTNLQNIAIPSYTHATPMWPVTALLGLQMRQAALETILKGTEDPKITGKVLYARAEEAWAALSALLGKNKWFFNGQDAGLFDASIFAYTHLILRLDWTGGGRALAEGLIKHSNLVNHEQRIRSKWYK